MNIMSDSMLRFSADCPYNPKGEFGIENCENLRQYHVMDTLITMSLGLVMASANLLLATEATTSEISDLRVLLVPFMGAVIMSCGAVLLNPEVEKRGVVMGRAFIALMIGTAAPSAIGAIFSSTKWMLEVPSLLLLSGGAICAIAYVLSRPFFARLYERSDYIARREVSRLERMTKADGEKGDKE